MDKKSLGKRINRARKDQRLTSEKLAEACNINSTYLRQIEGGKKTPSLPVFITICNQLKVSPTYLLHDSLKCTLNDDMDEITKLWSISSPSQLKMITAIIESALNTLDGLK